MKYTAKDYLGMAVHRAVVTVPAYFSVKPVDTTSIAGLQVERIINEPMAVALAYEVERKAHEDKPQTLLIYDLVASTI